MQTLQCEWLLNSRNETGRVRIVTEQRSTLRRERKRTDNFFLKSQYSGPISLAGTQSNKILLYGTESYFFHPSLYFFF